MKACALAAKEAGRIPKERPMTAQTLSLLTLTALALATPSDTTAQVFWINELHYDDAGVDNGEFVEVVGPADFTDLASVRLTLYNGADGQPYGASHHLGTFTVGATVEGLTVFSKLITGIQNGAPDGMSIDVGGVVRHFISYEGSFYANGGPAVGLRSTDIAFIESDLTVAGSSIGLVGSGRDPAEFVWMGTIHASPGVPNVDQTFAAVVPEPAEVGSVVGFALVVLGFWHRRRTCSSAPAAV